MNEEGKYLDIFILDGNWNEFKLSKFFVKEMVNIIKSINIWYNLQNDQLELFYKCSGIFIFVINLIKQYEEYQEDKYWSWIKNLI